MFPLLLNTIMATLLQFVNGLPSDFVLAPIYRKGAAMESGKEATGKNPVEAAHKRNLNPADAALIIERSSKVGAVGVWCGSKGNGVVILDVDRNLSALRKKWGETLSGAPVVRSPKENAAKFMFRVPAALWGELSGFGHSEEHCHGYEVLWHKKQGLIAGEYPDGGEYKLEGDLNNIPDAPEWLIAEMRAAKTPTGLVKNRSALNLDGRTEEQLITIVEECLTVIPNQGGGSREQWVQIGMSIHSALPNDKGLELWSDWSAEDPEFAHEWEKGNPCALAWSSFKPGGITLGTLIWHADQVDPDQTRFSEESRRIVDEAKQAVQRFAEARLSYDEVIKRGMACYEMDDIPRMNYELHKLANEAGYRDQGDLEQLITDYISSKDCGTRRTMDKRVAQTRDFVIPSLLPRPYTLLVHGREGSGKSASVLSLMKHVCDGLPFQLKGQEVQVQQGPVIYFNSDMSAQDFEEEFDLHEIKNQHLFHEVPDFNLYRKVQFMKIMKEVKPVMICIDSLSSCSGSKSENENKASFAQPIYWINSRNGKDWPPCTIAILHHTSKQTGEARGSTAIAAAAAEVWRVEQPSPDNKLRPDQRLITVGKSRIGRAGERLIQNQLEDLTVTLTEWQKPDEIQTKAGSLSEKILNRLLVSGAPMSRLELGADPLVGGSTSALRKTIQRMLNRGVINIHHEEQGSNGGKPQQFYVPAGKRSLGGTQTTAPFGQTPSAGTEDQWDTSHSKRGVSRWKKPNNRTGAKSNGTPLKTEDECPIDNASDTNGSAPTTPMSGYPRGLDDVQKAAFDRWRDA